MYDDGMSEFELCVRDLRDRHLNHGVLDYHIHDGTFVIDMISVDVPGQGTGSDIMRSLAEHADDHGMRMRLEASSHGGRNIRQGKLEKWYGRFGFLPTGETSTEGRPYMRREPQVRQGLVEADASDSRGPNAEQRGRR